MIHILFIDDDQEILELYSQVFSVDKNICTHCFHDPLKALAFLSKESADYIICDENLGELNGLEFLKRLRNFHHHKKTKYFLATGSVEIDRTEYEKLNCLGIFEKPFEVNEIKAMIKKDHN